MLIRHAACALGMLSVALSAFAQPLQPVDAEHKVATPYVMVYAEPQLRGDVRFLLAPSLFPQPPDLVGILRSSLGCDWRPTLVTPRVAQGTCRHLLGTKGGSVRGVLQLGPLGAALHRAGARQINFSLAAQGRSLGSKDTDWIHGSVGRHADSGTIADITNWSFSSYAGGGLPPGFAAEVNGDWSFRRLVAPLAIVLSGPLLLALWVRRKKLRDADRVGSGGIWLSWILLGAWLYWITVVSLQDLIGFANALDTDYWLVPLILGTVLFCGPPLMAVALCASVLVPGLNEESGESGIPWRTLRVALAGEATFMVPLGFFLMGTALVPQEFNAGLTAILLAYAAYRTLTFCVWRWTFRDMRTLVSGPLYERAVEIAAAAGVKLTCLTLVETRSAMEANAFASPGGRIGITRSLVENLSRREVDAIVGHEMGHSRGNTSWWRMPFLLFYMFVAGPAIARFASNVGLPFWVLDVPVIPLLYIMVTGWISQHQELLADARAAKVTNDPEACIAALASLARITKSPVDWKGIQGSILSHPSMRTRVLALAKESGVAEGRAIELLTNPGALVSEGAARGCYELPQFLEDRRPIYDTTSRHSHVYWCNWPFGVSLIGLLVLVYAIAMRLGLEFPVRVACLAASLPFVAAASLSIAGYQSRNFIRRMRRKIEAQRPPRPGGIFVAMLPGEEVYSVGGVYAWDLGHVYLGDESMTFEGERVQFTVDASAIQSVSVASGPLAWIRNYVALVRSRSATFSLRMADRGSSRGLAEDLVKRVAMWRDHATEEEVWREERSVELPEVYPSEAPRLRVIWHFAKIAGLLAIGASLATTIAIGYAFSTRLVPIAAVMIYLIIVSPTLFRRTS